LRDNGIKRMTIKQLTMEHQDIVLRCLKATAAHVDDWEKHSRLGLNADDLQRVINRWPHVNDLDETCNDFLAINNCMNEVCHGYSIDSADWENWFNTSMSEIAIAYQTWLSLGGISGGIR
jgi:hypothetical protein